MGNEVSSFIKDVSDYQYIADMDSLHNVLFEAGFPITTYEKVEIVDYINPEYFYVESEKDIISSIGTLKLEKDDNKQKVIWTIKDLPTNKKVNLEILIKLKQNYIDMQDDIYFPTNEREIITTKFLKQEEEIIESVKTPVLKNYHNVIYDLNLPDTCTIESIPVEKYKYGVSVMIANDLEKCGDYDFNGWEIITSDVKKYNDDSFVMPEKDVLIRAVWSKTGVTKSMDGKIYTGPISIMQARSVETTEELWKYRGDITKIVIQNDFYDIANVIDEWDLSDTNNRSVIGKLVIDPNDSSKYVVYIQGNRKIFANYNCNGLFEGFTNLKSIDGLEYFDTSTAEYMVGMFANNINLTSLNLRNFDTSHVLWMNEMFYRTKALTKLDISSFDTAKVTNMESMFSYTGLTSLDISHFNTSNVTDMSNMFRGSSLVSLELGDFKTSNVQNMNSMFYYAESLSSLDVSSFDTSKVTDMGNMFRSMYSLKNLNISNFDTRQVKDMSYMFCEDKVLETLNLGNLKTLQVTDMSNMFRNCPVLNNLDVSSFDTSNVTNMSGMFWGADSLVTLDLNSFNTSKVTDMSWMFGTSSLKTLDFRKATFDAVTDTTFMFFSGINTIKTKDDITKSWLQERLNELGITNVTITVVE